ncbi:lytic transglycosylase domain-containing protein [Roseicella aquatilis]|uniref:Lytic transglycosylase domain-containing protein n=1 Tax=Roseicella aquatilis TaxID=2527868 RepID=A0A4R4DJE6_9PROT|nr:lytic transglycosylase domain-containing protein [Roseicella aquatilis]TCZ61293.1 lytic transglycosylase domain-containing protein [Roseicella aquatilis]
MPAIGPMARGALRPLLAGVLWGAALMAGGSPPAAAQRATDQTAMSVPRPAPPGGVPGLPQVLAPSDAARLRRIFDLQSRGDLAAATRESERLDDRRLMGHVLADRTLRPQASPGAPEVQSWLAHYADHPDALRLHDLLGRLMPRGAALPAPPAQAEALSPDASLAPEERGPASLQVTRQAWLDRAVRDRALEGNASAGLSLIARAKGVSPAYAGMLRADLATGLFRAGKDAEALRIAGEAARAGEPSGQATFAAGLAAWGFGEYEAALPYFERSARNGQAAPALRAAAAFWTARAAVRARRPQLYVSWMMQAAQEPRTFYGLVARRALGLPAGFAWEGELAGEAEAAAVAETAGGWRALALLQVGQPARAEAELRQLWGQAKRNPALVRAMLAVAGQAGLTGLTTQLAAASQAEDGRPRDFARYPVPKLMPLGGFRVDPALLYGLVLQESRFDAGAVSPAGARGLTQMMPATASYLVRDGGMPGGGAARLHEPAYALELGQRYLHHLARHDGIENNLIRVLAAYNAGPGNLLKWLPAHGHRDDPFLFVEAIPFDETRHYVKQVLTNSWIYASRFGLPAPSLDQLAAGSFPKFSQPEEILTMLRGRGATLH